MSVLMRLILLLSAALSAASARAACDLEFEAKFQRLVEAEAAIGRAETGVQGYAASPARSGLRSAVDSERATIDRLLEEFATKGNLNTGQLADLEARVLALQEAAQAPPVNYVIGDHLGNPRKTPLPADHETVFAGAIPEPGRGGNVWWGYNGSDFYRFQGGEVGGLTNVHFNGSTGSLGGGTPIAVGDVPKEVRRYFGVK